MWRSLSLSFFLALGSDAATQSTVCQKSWNEEAIWTRGKTSTPSFPGVLEMFHFPPETQMDGGFSRWICKVFWRSAIQLLCIVSVCRGNLPTIMYFLLCDVSPINSAIRIIILFLKPPMSKIWTCFLCCSRPLLGDPWLFFHPFVPLTQSMQTSSHTAAHPHLWPAPPLKYHRILPLDVALVPTNTTKRRESSQRQTVLQGFVELDLKRRNLNPAPVCLPVHTAHRKRVNIHGSL